VLYRYEIALERVLDLTDNDVRTQVGISPDILTGPDWMVCQELGSVLHTIGAQAVNSPSATGVGAILAVFAQQIGLDRLEPQFVEEWHSPGHLDR
jgi:RES domain-containing protein